MCQDSKKPFHRFRAIFLWPIEQRVSLITILFSLAVANSTYSLLWCSDFSMWWLLLLWTTGSRYMSWQSGSRSFPVRALTLTVQSSFGRSHLQSSASQWLCPGCGAHPSLPSSPRSREFCGCWCRIASYSCVTTLAVGCPGRGHGLGEGALYSWGNTQGLTAKAICQQHSQQPDNKSLERRPEAASHCPPQSSSLKPVWFSPSCNRAVKKYM